MIAHLAECLMDKIVHNISKSFYFCNGLKFSIKEIRKSGMVKKVERA